MIGLALSVADASLLMTTIELAEPYLAHDEAERLKGVRMSLLVGVQRASQDGTA
jgi:hypothetical protein